MTTTRERRKRTRSAFAVNVYDMFRLSELWPAGTVFPVVQWRRRSVIIRMPWGEDMRWPRDHWRPVARA